ncbi:hypothetical protein CLU79DRAFT_741747 [Phycomyces nitens]|nr:hypothetical protein CLU79DRAFT_741747 [Phycomyces nitens]
MIPTLQNLWSTRLSFLSGVWYFCYTSEAQRGTCNLCYAIEKEPILFSSPASSITQALLSCLDDGTPSIRFPYYIYSF